MLHRDPNGRVFKTETIREAEWLPEDLEAVLIWQREQASLCSGCGLPTDETMDPENEEAYVGKAVQCHACAARDSAAKVFISGSHDPNGLMFAIERRP